MYLLFASFLILLGISVMLFARKITLGIWSISVFNSRTMVFERLNVTKLMKPTLKASDITDIHAEFVADPFIISHASKIYMFFEILDKSSGKGVIGLATSEEGEKWEYGKVVLKENFHLSYPYIFKHNDLFYMIPEASESNQVMLYKAKNFPYDWEAACRLLEGAYVDSSIFRYKNTWWMFAGRSGKLHLFYSDDLEKNWKEHVKSPLISNNYNITRPGGRVIVDKGNIYRYTQDGQPTYGSAVRVFKITHLSEAEYKEEEMDMILCGSNKNRDWKKDGMHTIDQLKLDENQWLIAVDGHKLENKNHVLWKLDRIRARIFKNRSEVY